MRTLVINGSPRRNGDSMTLVNEMVNQLHGEVQTVHVYYDGINPCNDCRYCWTNPKCAINDCMQDIYGLLNEADNVVMASPLHFSTLSSGLLGFASRLQFLYASRCIRHGSEHILKRKNGVLVISAGGDSEDPTMATSLAHTIFKNMNVRLIGSVQTLNTNGIPALEDATALNKVRQLALKLNDLGSRSGDEGNSQH